MHLFLKMSKTITVNLQLHAQRGLSRCSKTIELGLISKQPTKKPHILSPLCTHAAQGEGKKKRTLERFQREEITIYGIGIQLLAWIIQDCDAIRTISFNIPQGLLSITLFQAYLDSFSHSFLSHHQYRIWFLLPVYKFLFFQMPAYMECGEEQIGSGINYVDYFFLFSTQASRKVMPLSTPLFKHSVFTVI